MVKPFQQGKVLCIVLQELAGVQAGWALFSSVPHSSHYLAASEESQSLVLAQE